MEKTHGTKVKEVLNELGVVAEKADRQYLDVNVVGLTDISINAHELNTLISVLKRPGGFHNKEVYKKIIITSARLLSLFEDAEAEQRLALEKEKAEKEADNNKAAENKPRTRTLKNKQSNQKSDNAQDNTKDR